MRKFFLISVVVLTTNFKVIPQSSISVVCDEIWGPGRYNKVTCTIKIDNSVSFARFIQDFPVGFEIIIDNYGDGNYNWANNQLNLVWMRIPESKILTFSYLIKPEKSMNGSFTMTGRLITVSGASVHQTTYMKEKNISIEGLNGILPEKIKSGSEAKTELKAKERPENQTTVQKGEIRFRVQVSVSSSRITEGELKRELGLGKDTDVKIIQVGKIYKYQAGSFSSYDSASILLKQVIARGYKDAFIVAYRDKEQIPVKKALNYSK